MAQQELNKEMAPGVQRILWLTAIVSGVCTALVFTYVGLIACGVPLPRF